MNNIIEISFEVSVGVVVLDQVALLARELPRLPLLLGEPQLRLNGHRLRVGESG